MCGRIPVNTHRKHSRSLADGDIVLDRAARDRLGVPLHRYRLAVPAPPPHAVRPLVVRVERLTEVDGKLPGLGVGLDRLGRAGCRCAALSRPAAAAQKIERKLGERRQDELRPGMNEGQGRTKARGERRSGTNEGKRCKEARNERRQEVNERQGRTKARGKRRPVPYRI